MFSISDRYIGRQVLMTTLFAVSILTGVLMLGTLFKEIRFFLVDFNAPLLLVGKYLLNFIPYSMMFTLPWGFLSAILLVFGRLSSHNEIVSLRMAGHHLPRIALPIYLLAGALCVLSYWINSEVAPSARSSRNDVVLQAVKTDPSSLLSPGAIGASFKQGKIYVEGSEDTLLSGFHFYQLPDDPDDTSSTYIHADRAKVIVDEEAKQLRLALFDTYIESRDEENVVTYARAASAEPLLFDYAEKEKRRKRPKEMVSSAIRNELPSLTAKLSRISATLTSLEPGPADEIEVEVLENKQKDTQKRIYRMRYELGRRASFSLACLSFAIVGFPLALNGRRRETSSGLIVSIGIAGLYFASLIVAKNSEEHGAILVWLPNIFCFIIGLVLLRRARFR